MGIEVHRNCPRSSRGKNTFAGLGPLWSTEDKAPLNLLDVLFWMIYRLSTSPPVWTQYRLLLSFLGGYVSSCKKIRKSGKLCSE